MYSTSALINSLRYLLKKLFCDELGTTFLNLPQIRPDSSRFTFNARCLFGLFGFGSYLKTPEKPLNTSANQIALSSSNKTQNPNKELSLVNNNVTNRGQKQSAAINANSQNIVNAQVIQNTQTLPTSKEPVNSQISVAEPVHFCGAQTKKGTPCTRRVKNSGRCWQHIGQPAMLPKEKLIVSQ